MLKFKNIVVHYDSFLDTHPGLDYAVELAEANHGRIKIVEMIPDFPWATRQFLGGYERMLENITQTKTRGLQEAAERLRERGIDVTTKLLDGRTSVALIREVLEDDHDLVIKKAKGQRSRKPGFFVGDLRRRRRHCRSAPRKYRYRPAGSASGRDRW